MAITKEQKKAILAELEQIAKSPSVVFVHAVGLGVNTSNDMRAKLRAQGIGYKVAKKTLIRRAFEAASIEGELPALDGEIAVAYGEDLTAPAREVYAFQKELKDNVSIVGGVFEGKFKDQAGMMEIATIPPTQTLRGMFVNIINSPIQQFVSVLDQVAKAKEQATA